MSLYSSSHSERSPPPDLPAQGTVEERNEIARKSQLQTREAQERVRMMRGLVLLAFLVLLASMLRAGHERVFVPGWRRQW